MNISVSQGRQFVNGFTEAYKTARLLETLENYTVSDIVNIKDQAIEEQGEVSVQSDEQFWRSVLEKPDNFIGKKISIHSCTLTSWVPRVPGLYWSAQATSLRKFAEGYIETVSGSWIHYAPLGKSAIIMGGIGTNMFSPDADGNRILCLTTQHNASLGIPALITAEIWEGMNLKDGYSLEVRKGTWQLMDQQWITRFPSMKGIPKAYLVVNKPEQIKVVYQSSPNYTFHPYSIMEYYIQDATFYDYVFASENRRDSSRKELTQFFEWYRIDKGRNGKYLLHADISNPYFEAKYYSPEELRRNEITGKTHLHILEEKIKHQYFKGQLLDEIIIALTNKYQDEDEIRRIAAYAGISKAQIPRETPSNMISRLVDLCLEAGTLEELIDRAAIEYPELIK